MDKATRDKALDKIRKCLALSRSANEHEAAAALRQAQKLMAMHGLSEDDVGQVEYLSVLVVCRDYEYGKKKPLMLNSVVALIADALGVRAVWGSHRSVCSCGLMFCITCGHYPKPVHSVRYFGQRARVIIAEHAHGVVYRAVGSAWREYSRGRRMRRGARASFYYGWCMSVSEKVQALVLEPAEVEAIERAKARHYGKTLGHAALGSRTIISSVAIDGADAARSFDMNRPLGQDRLRIEKL